MKKGEKVKTKNKSSNRFIYFLVTLGILALVSGGVYAYTASGAGHNSNEINVSSGFSEGVYSNNAPTYAKTQLNTWGLSSLGTMYLEPNPGDRLYIVPSDWSQNLNTLMNGDFYVGGRIQANISGGDANLASIGYTISGTHIAGQTIYSYDKICVGNSGGYCNGVGGTVLSSTSVYTPLVSAAAFVYSSDKSLKTNIKPLQNSLEKIKQLQGVSFNWKESGRADIGLVAQDVEKVFPELVSTNENNLKSVEYGNLVGVLIEAVKEQQKQIDELKSKCN
jgi:hypothetical protein